MKMLLHKIILVAVLLFLLAACKNKTATVAVPKQQEKDSVSQWLDNDTNYTKRNTTGYIDTFTKHYTASVAAKNKLLSLNLLSIYASTVNHLEVTDSFLLQTALVYIKNTPVTAQNKQQIEYLYFIIGHQYYFVGNNATAKEWLQKTTLAADTVVFTKNLPSCYLLLGNIAFMENSFEPAIAHYLKAVSFYERLNDTTNISTTYINIANCYSALHSSYYFYYYSNKAIALAEQGNKVSNALKYRLKKTYFAFDENRDSTQFIQSVTAITAAYNGLPEKSNRLSFQVMGAGVQKCLYANDMDSANYFLQQCIGINKIANRQEYQEQIDVYTEMCFFAKHKTVQNEQKVLGYAQQMEAYKIYSTAIYYYGLLSQNAKATGNTKQALFYTEKLQSLKDTVQVNNEKGKLFDLQTKYETEKKQQQIKLQKKTISSKNNFIAFLLTALGLGVLGFLYYQQKQRQHKLQQQSINQMNFSQQLLQQTEEDRKRIAADLHDSVSHELISLKKSIDNNTGGLQQKVDGILEEIRSISRNLSPVLFDNVGLQLTVEQMVERVQMQNNFILTADINYNNSLSSASDLQVYRILQEAVTNMVKYSKAIAGKITITEDAQNILIEIKDNGKGFNVTDTLNSGKAFGLHNIIERSRAIGGVAIINSGAGGTVINIDVKK